MTTRQLQLRAYREWNSSTENKGRYHTFEYYWHERYARVYQLPSHVWPASSLAH
jgi:hypothetical protein